MTISTPSILMSVSGLSFLLTRQASILAITSNPMEIKIKIKIKIEIKIICYQSKA